MSDSTPYFYLVGRQGLRPDGTLSRNPGEWKTYYAHDVDKHLNAGMRPARMKSGDFHAKGSYQYNKAVGVREAS
jgi:hypothetical protein